MGIVNMETLPVDRHVWYDGDIVIRDEYRGGAEDAVECGFSDLSEESKETVKNLIIEMAREFSNTSHIAPLCDLTLDDGTEIPNASVDFSCSVQVADRFRNSSVWQNERSEYLTNLPDAVIEAVVSDILDEKDGKVKIDQLSFGDYLNQEKLKDLFSKKQVLSARRIIVRKNLRKRNRNTAVVNMRAGSFLVLGFFVFIEIRP